MTRRNGHERRELATISLTAEAVLYTSGPDNGGTDGPLTSLVTALAAGAAVTLEATVEQAPKTATPP
jgi:uncharacterized protein YciI